MKRLIAIFALIATISTINAEVIFKDGFEEGELIGWKVWKSMPNVKLQMEDVFKGEFSAMFNKAGGIERNMKLQPGKYQVKYFSKRISGDEGNVEIRRKPDDNWKFYGITSLAVPKATEYTESVINFKVKNEGLYKIVIQSPHTSSFLFDNLRIEKIVE